MLKGKVAVITGATRGIGREIAKIFASNGANLVIIGRSVEALESLKNDIISEYGVRVTVKPYEISDARVVKEVAMAVFKEFGQIDILINNAGIMKPAPLMLTSEDNLRSQFEVNYFGAFYHLQAYSRLMERKRSGSIINIGSIIGQKGFSNQSAYASSKGALFSLTLSAAKELAPSAIRVNLIAPGFIQTEMTESLSDADRRDAIGRIAMGRFGQATDVGNAALFLASDLSSYVTGQCLGVDGGMVI